MPYFRGDFCGGGFPGSVNGGAGKVGFFAARYVQAGNAQEAHKLLLEGMWKEPELKFPQGNDREATIIIERLVEVDAAEAQTASGSGFTFFSECS